LKVTSIQNPPETSHLLAKFQFKPFILLNYEKREKKTEILQYLKEKGGIERLASNFIEELKNAKYGSR